MNDIIDPGALTRTLSRILTGNAFYKGCPEEELFFVSHCLMNYEKSYSQALQDLWVLYETGYKHNGYFVDFGAADGLHSSNSYKLSKEYGWSGILVEPNEDYQAPLETNSTALVKVITGVCVSGKSDEYVDFVIGDDPSLATTYKLIDKDRNETKRDNRKSIRLPTISLLDLLKQQSAPRHIDYISIDTEGNEYEILEGFDFSQYDVDMFTIEYNGIPEKLHSITNMMFNNGYALRFPAYSRMDLWFIKRSLVENRQFAIKRNPHRKRTIKTIHEIITEEL